MSGEEDGSWNWKTSETQSTGGPDSVGSSPDGSPLFDEDLWLDRVTQRFGFGRLASHLPGSPAPALVYTVVMLATVEPVLNYMSYRIGEPIIYLNNPYFILQPVALIAAAYGARSLRTRYHHVMYEMEIHDRATNADRITDIVPRWLPWAFFLVGVCFNFSRVIARGGFDAIYQDAGIPGLIAWGIVNPFIWVPVGAQFLAVYLSIEILAPWRLARSDVGIHFRDPEGLGGLRPIGELLKHAYYYLMGGLIAYALIAYAPLISPEEWEVTGVAQGVFTAAWIGTILTVGFGVFVLHRFMHREKRETLRRLERQANKCIRDPWDIATYEVPDEERERVDEIQTRMDRVSATKEYPATFSIWSQLLLSIVLPKLIQLGLVGL